MTPYPPTLFTQPRQSVEADTAAREAAIAQVEASSEEWIGRAMTILLALAKARPTLCSDDVWFQIPAHDRPREPRGMGVVFRRGMKQGWIEPTNEYRKSIQGTNHRREVKIWKSKLCT